MKRLIAFLFIPWRKKVKPKKVRALRDPGLYSFRKTILGRLDLYFYILKRLKKGSPETYACYSRYGATALSTEDIDQAFSEETVPPWWLQTRPSFGAYFVSAGATDKENVFRPTFMCFRKFEKHRAPPELQKAPGDIYVVTVCWDDIYDSSTVRKWKHGRPTEFALALSDKGKITILRTRADVGQKIRVKHGKDKGTTVAIPNKKYHLAPFFHGWAKDNPDQGDDVYDFLSSIFIQLTNLYTLQNHEMTKIGVTRGKLKAIFTIPIERTPYFFKDRDLVTVESGRRKPIFHIVRTHRRVTTAGGVFIKTHFRGQKKFTWNNYRIAITIPGWDHWDLSELDIGSQDHPYEEGPIPKDMMGVTELSKYLLNIENSGRGKLKRERSKAA